MAQIGERVDGVVFDRRDCAGTARRLVAALVDGAIMAGFAIGSGVWAGFTFGGKPGFQVWAAICGMAAIAWFVFLKRTAWSTPGYRLAGIRIVALDGATPGVWPMFLRLAIATLWPLTGSIMAVIDVVWISGDEQCQSLRDKIAGTLVVRRHAKPVATGRQTVRLYTFLGFALYLREVRPSTAGPAVAVAPQPRAPEPPAESVPATERDAAARR